MNIEEIKAMPKIELHCHLDGSLSKEFMEKRLGREVKTEEITVSENCRDLAEYLEKFALPCTCLQDEESLREAGFDFIKTCAEENVIYVEVRFAPAKHMQNGLTLEQVIQAVIDGLERGKSQFGVNYGLIACAMRGDSLEDNKAVFKAAWKFLRKGLVAVDLAGNEAAYPMKMYEDLFKYASNLGLPYTVHAGECGDIQNVIDAVWIGAKRIGHGIALKGNKQMEEMVANYRHLVGVEMCPISNLQTRAVACEAEYPIREFLDMNVPVSINTDNRTVSGTSLTKELAFIQEHYGITDDELYLLMKNAAHTSFAEPKLKERLEATFER